MVTLRMWLLGFQLFDTNVAVSDVCVSATSRYFFLFPFVVLWWSSPLMVLSYFLLSVALLEFLLAFFLLVVGSFYEVVKLLCSICTAVCSINNFLVFPVVGTGVGDNCYVFSPFAILVLVVMSVEGCAF